jgi:carboxylate-amine ligase
VAARDLWRARARRGGDEDLRIDLLRQIGDCLPHLPALGRSSPFREGQPTGREAFRPTIVGDLPRTGLPEDADSWSEGQRLLREMAECGVCDDATRIWWDVRPSVKQPTLEMRACDICTRLEDAVCIAALYQCILRMLFDLRTRNQRWRIYRRILLEENKWRAQRWGVEAKLAA